MLFSITFNLFAIELYINWQRTYSCSLSHLLLVFHLALLRCIPRRRTCLDIDVQSIRLSFASYLLEVFCMPCILQLAWPKKTIIIILWKHIIRFFNIPFPDIDVCLNPSFELDLLHVQGTTHSKLLQISWITLLTTCRSRIVEET